MQYHATDLLPLKDERIVGKVMSCLSNCIKDIKNATVTDREIERLPKSLTHFFPGNSLCVSCILKMLNWSAVFILTGG